jgi:hypothetical protein
MQLAKKKKKKKKKLIEIRQFLLGGIFFFFNIIQKMDLIFYVTCKLFLYNILFYLLLYLLAIIKNLRIFKN